MTNHLLHSRKYFATIFSLLFFTISFLTFPVQSIAQTRTSQRERRVQIFFAYNPTRPTAGQEVQFQDFTRGNPTSWLWDFGDGQTSILQNPRHTFPTPGSYKVILTARNGTSSGRTSRNLNVILTVSASFTYGPSYPVTGQAVQFTDTSTGGPTSWLWNFGDNTSSTSQNPSHAYATAGTYAVTLTVGFSSGSKTVSQTITVAPSLSASFTFSPSSPTAGQAVQFRDTSTGNSTSWLWNFGDNTSSTAQNPSHTYATVGSYSVTLTVAYSSGSKSASQTINVVTPPALTASFSYSPSSPVAGQTVQFTDTSTGSPTSWLWNFGDNTTSSSQNPSHAYSAAATYTVTLTVTNSSASRSVSQNISIMPESTLTASFTYSPPSPEAGQVVQFTDTSAGSPTSWQWNFGDSATAASQNPSHTYAAAGTYWVSLIIMRGTSSHSVSQAISILPASPLTASFTFSPSSPMAGQVVQFTDTSKGSPTSWQWNFGDSATSTIQNPSHTYATAGTYTVNLTVRNSSGSSSVSQTVNVIATSGIIPQDRRIDWSRAGVWENGYKWIPGRTVVFCNVKVSIPGSTLVAIGNGIQDDTAALQAAINGCPVGQVVYLPQGNYRINGTLDITKGIVVRGAGPSLTKIIQYANSDVFTIHGTGSSGIVTDVTSGYSKGSDTVVVSNAANFAVGALVLIDQINDPALVTQVGHEGPCTWCGREGGNRSMGEVLLITEKSGNTIKFSRPLYYNYGSSFLPQLSRMTTTTLTHAGVENLYVESASTVTSGNGFSMYWCAYCWLMNVESNGIPGKNVEIKWAACGNEVRDSYFHNATRFDGDHGYGVNINSHSTDNLIENNIFYWLHAPVEIGSGGGAGNIIGYNYIERSQHYQANWFISHMGTHGAHTYMNLFEGNVCGKVGLDSTWGSGSHNVFFRNRISGVNTGTTVTQAQTAADIMSLNYYVTFVGNIFGYPGYVGVVEQIPYLRFDNNLVLWRIGFWAANVGYPTDLKVAQTLLKTGNWESPNNTVQWTTSERAIPDSLYLTSKPSWFGNLAWPPFTPERSDFDPNNFNKIPAQARFGR